MLKTERDVENFSKECFDGLSNILGVRCDMPEIAVYPIDEKAYKILGQIDDEEAYQRRYLRNLDKAFYTGMPKRDLIRAVAEEIAIENNYLAQYDQEKNTLDVSIFPSVSALERFNRTVELKPVKATKNEVLESSEYLKESIAGELMLSIRAGVTNAIKTSAEKNRFIVASRWGNTIDMRSVENLADREYRYRMRKGGYRIDAVVDVDDFFLSLGYLLGPKAVKKSDFSYAPTSGYENALRIRDIVGSRESLESSASRLLKLEVKKNPLTAYSAYDPYTTVMADVCATNFMHDSDFIEKHVYKDPVINQPAGDLLMRFF